MDMDEIVAIEYYDTDGAGPFTYAELMARLPERTEAEWRHYERLELTVGRAHEGDQP